MNDTENKTQKQIDLERYSNYLISWSRENKDISYIENEEKLSSLIKDGNSQVKAAIYKALREEINNKSIQVNFIKREITNFNHSRTSAIHSHP